MIYWSFSSEGMAAAKITRTNPDGSQTPFFSGADVDLQGPYEDLMMDLGVYIYTLNVSAEFGGTANQSVVVNVDIN